MLTDQQLERYSRQILLPEVGGRGQERLLAATVVVAGTDAATGVAAALLGRAGIGILALAGADVPHAEPSPDCRVVRYDAATDAPAGDIAVDLSGDPAGGRLLRRHAAAGRPCVVAASTATGATLATLVGRPCIACLPAGAMMPPPGEEAPGPLAAPLPILLGALAAVEALRVLLCPTVHGRLHRLGLRAAAFDAAEPPPPGACAVCGGTA